MSRWSSSCAPWSSRGRRPTGRGSCSVALARSEGVDPDGRQPGRSPHLRLSDRELQVLRLLDGELSGPEIARALFVSHNTLRTHTKHIFTKLDVTTRRAAVRRARDEGLL